MKIVRQLINESDIEEFAVAYGLTMRVVERDAGAIAYGAARFYANFEHAEVAEGVVLVGVHGNGSTEEEAIRDYARRISERVLVLNAYAASRKEIKVPRLDAAKKGAPDA